MAEDNYLMNLRDALRESIPERRQNQNADQRRPVAIEMLHRWRVTANTAEALKRLNNEGDPKVQALTFTEANTQLEADDLREEILMLMGVDDTPAAEFELSDEPTPGGPKDGVS